LRNLTLQDKNIKEHFNSVSASYTTKSEGFPWSIIRSKELKDFLNHSIMPEKGDCVLEVGAGAGFYTKYLYNDKLKYYLCLDVSNKMLNQINLNVDKKCGDISSLDEKVKYNKIYALGVVEFFAHPQSDIISMLTKLEKKGSAYLFLPKNNFWGRLYQKRHLRNEIGITLFKESDIENYIPKGFKVFMKKKIGFFNTLVGVKKL
jgi:SAM-dependent methyltransferase